MPELALGQDTVEGLPDLACGYLASVMLWPAEKSASERAAAYAAVHANLIRLEVRRQRAQTPARIVDWMMDAPRIGDLNAAISTRRYRQGLVAGWILGEMVFRSKAGNPSSLKGVMRDAALLFALGRDRPGPSTRRRHVDDIWADYKSAAHLWAAHRMRTPRGAAMLPCHPNEVSGFLARAEWFRREAEALKPYKSPVGTLLLRGAAWTVPASIPLPAGEMKIARAMPR